MQARETHYVTFMSPGTFVSETTTRPIHAWDRELACAMAKTIVERYGAKPYAFRFTTRLEALDVVQTDRGSMSVQPRQIAQSGIHFLGGKVLTLADVEARDDPGDSILISNMRGNGFERVIEIVNGYRSVFPFGPEDVIVGDNGQIIRMSIPQGNP